ncbi:glycerophosphodiester phosphodiesterase family protein [Ekhidna sp.]
MSKWLLAFIILSYSCSQKKNLLNIEIQGHRGARGLAPENSIPGFILAVDLGVNTLELDLVVSKDKKLIVSHESFFSSDFCLDTMSRPIEEDSIINIYQLSYCDIKKFDWGQ